MKKIGFIAFLCLYFLISGCIEKPDSPIPAWVTENSDGQWHAGESGRFKERKFDSSPYVYMGVQQQGKYLFLFAWCDNSGRINSELHLFGGEISTNPTFLKEIGAWVHASDVNFVLGGKYTATFFLIRALENASIFRIVDVKERYLSYQDSGIKVKFSDQSSILIPFSSAYELLGNSCAKM